MDGLTSSNSDLDLLIPDILEPIFRPDKELAKYKNVSSQPVINKSTDTMDWELSPPQY
jgi:hypothetical protein